MDSSYRGTKLANGSFEPREHADAEVVLEETPFDEVSQQFFDCKSDVNSEGERKGPGSDAGSIPLKPYSLEIINGGPGEEIPGPEEAGTKKSRSYTAVRNADQDSEATEIIDFLQDDPKEMTYGRRIALYMMKKFSWYNPQLSNTTDRGMGDIIIDEGRFRSQDGYPITHSKQETPSLEKAWAYFDHVALPRYIFKPKDNNVKKSIPRRIINKWNKADKELQRAEPGERELATRLYSTVFTPHKQLGDFGLGIGLYFSTLRGLTLLALIAGIIHIPNFMYFSREEYSDGQPNMPNTIRGSAICTRRKWVPCPTCSSTMPGMSNATVIQDPDTKITFALKNLCDGATIEQGMVNYAALVFVVLAAMVLNRYLHYMEVQFDEDEQTAQDYSIIINNPPPDATEPEEWKEFFRNGFDAQVTACTIAVDNDILVRTLVERREKMRMLELLVEPGTKLDIVTLAGIAAAEERKRTFLQSLLAMLSPGTPEIFGRMAVLTAKVQGLAQQNYPVTNVFIVFEREADQRRVLEKLSVGQASVDTNRTASVRDAKYLFRGETVLSVLEPEEPDSIRWEDLNVGFIDRMKQQFFTALATVAALILVTVVVYAVNDTSPALTAYIISIANAIFPMFAKALAYSEDHPSHGSLQTSLYFKIALFRWTTTALVITLITPFTDILKGEKGGLIPQINAQFFAEVTTTTFLQLVDPFGHVQRHFLAPRATTQDAMNLLMQGTKFELAERYTAAAKLLFLTFWYCAVFPGAFFWCAFAMQVIYYLDKFSLTRTWKRVPKLGSTISQFNRRYFLPLSIVAMAVFSSYYWSGFPFDNLCDTGARLVNSNYTGSHLIPIGAKETISDMVAGLGNTTVLPLPDLFVAVTAEAGDPIYHYCLQDYLRTKGRQTFPFIPRFQTGSTRKDPSIYDGEEWMTEDQELVTTIYGWTAFGFISAYIAVLIFMEVFSFFNYFNGNYVAVGDDQGENFSELESSNIYIPQVESLVFSYPLLACSVDDIDPDMLDWTDPEHPHAFYDLTKDAHALIRGTDISAKHVFSQVAHWPAETTS